MACGADEIAAMLSNSSVLGEMPGRLNLCIDDIPGAVEDSRTITSTDVPSSRSTLIEKEKTATYKSKEELTEAVTKKKEAIHRVFKMMQYAEEVNKFKI